jgi:hypothetical protein
LILIPYDRIRGLDASLRGDSSIDLSFSLEYVWGASRAWLEPWPCTGASLLVPDSTTRGQLSNPGRGPAFDPSRFISGSEPVTHLSRNIHPWILFLPILGACFQEEKRDRHGSGRRGATVTECMVDTCPYRWILRERLGKVIECSNRSYLFARSLAFHRGISVRPRVPYAPYRPFCVFAFFAFFASFASFATFAPFSHHPTLSLLLRLSSPHAVFRQPWQIRARSFLWTRGLVPR